MSETELVEGAGNLLASLDVESEELHLERLEVNRHTS